MNPLRLSAGINGALLFQEEKGLELGVQISRDLHYPSERPMTPGLIP